MKIKKMIKYIMVVATVSIIFTACKKDKDEQILDSDTTAASDNALAEATYNDVNNIADEAATGSLSSYFVTNNNGEKEMLSACATVTMDSTGSGSTLVRNIHINFGTTNCLCADGRYRRGIINVAISGGHFYWDSLAVKTITFADYFVNDNQIMGTKTVTNNGHNAAGNYTFSITVSGSIIKASGAGTITWTSSRTREWFQNGTPLDHSDDHYLIRGSASGTNAAGNAFALVITTPLRKDVGCHHFVSGTFELTPATKPLRVVDYGTGTCDNIATVTISGHTYTITLH